MMVMGVVGSKRFAGELVVAYVGGRGLLVVQHVLQVEEKMAQPLHPFDAALCLFVAREV